MNSSAITLRRATTQDAAAFARVMSEPGVFENLLQLPHTSADLWHKRLTDMLSPDRPGDLLLVAELDGEVVGNAGLNSVGTNLRRRHAAMLGIVVSRQAQGRGVGRALMQALIDHADGWAQILRIELTVFSDNQRAIELYQRFGFEVEGTHRGYALRNGRFDDVLAMARLHPNPPRWS